MNDKFAIWETLVKEKYPDKTNNQIKVLALQGASRWYLGERDELTQLYDQYVMLKTLHGYNNKDD